MTSVPLFCCSAGVLLCSAEKIADDAGLGYPERIADLDSGNVSVTDEVIGKLSADTQHCCQLLDIDDVRIVGEHHLIELPEF